MIRTIAASALALAAVIGAANPITFTTTGLGDNVGVSYIDLAGPGGHNGYAGELRFTDGVDTFSTLCVDLRATIGGGASWNAPITPLTIAEGNYFLAGSIMAGNIGSVATGTDWAALQLAVWEAVYDGNSGDFGNGNFVVDSAATGVVPLAQIYFGIRDTNANVLMYGNQTNESGGYVAGQAQIRVVPVPEPCSLAALGIGALAVIRKRRKSR